MTMQTTPFDIGAEGLPATAGISPAGDRRAVGSWLDHEAPAALVEHPLPARPGG